MTTSNPLKWHGGKTYMAPKLIELMPPRCKNPNNPQPDDPGYLHYVEPYAGGLAVLFAMDPKGISEVVNDKHGELINFWQTLADVERFAEFTRIVENMPLAQPLFQASLKELPMYSVDRAARFFVQYRQSRQGLGKDFATMTRNRTRRGMNEQASAWLSSVEGLPEAHSRLRPVVILNDHAPKVIRQQDGLRTLYYIDPTYLHETRVTTGDYEHEMSSRAHAVLLATISPPMKPDADWFLSLDGSESMDEFESACEYAFQGRFLLSGYPSGMYARFEAANGWRHVDFLIDNKASSKAVKDQECERVWMNY